MILTHGSNSIGSGGSIELLDYIKSGSALSKMEINITKLNNDAYDFSLNYGVKYLSGSYPLNDSSFFIADSNSRYLVTGGAPGSGSYRLGFQNIFGASNNIGNYTEEFFNKIKLFFDKDNIRFIAAEGGTGQIVHGYINVSPSFFSQINFIVPSNYHEFKFHGAQIYGKSYKPARKTDTNELGVIDEEYNFYAGVDLLGGYDE